MPFFVLVDLSLDVGFYFNVFFVEIPDEHIKTDNALSQTYAMSVAPDLKILDSCKLSSIMVF